MQLLESYKALQSSLRPAIHQQKKIGFVPTMGALHSGHISLINRSVKDNDITVASIFVNPAQFNDPKDLAQYPRTPDADHKLLEFHKCDYVFEPVVNEMYPSGKIDLIDMDLGNLANTMEGKFRQGHFQGMATIVYKLLKMVEPTNAYFGEKDFQQLAIIRFMVKKISLKVHIIGCSTVREPDGLAMSSRNIHLTSAERAFAPVIYNSLQYYTDLNKVLTVKETIRNVVDAVQKNNLFHVEYFEIVNAETLASISDWTDAPQLRACIAVKASKTRLIDNIEVKFDGRG